MIFHDQRMLRGVDRVKPHLERESLAEKMEYGAHIAFHFLRAMDDQLAEPSQHAQGGDQAGKPEAMIAMQVGDENVIQSAEFDAHTAHLHLRALSAVDHIQFVAQVDDLRCRQMASRRQGGSAPQYVHAEVCHF